MQESAYPKDRLARYTDEMRGGAKGATVEAMIEVTITLRVVPS
ncbi:MAG TPA: hypothetical protein VID03_09650 [Acidimicrobiia bacterium]